jgi:hypothetical protein
MTIATLQNIINRGESTQIEFKAASIALTSVAIV